MPIPPLRIRSPRSWKESSHPRDVRLPRNLAVLRGTGRKRRAKSLASFLILLLVAAVGAGAVSTVLLAVWLGRELPDPNRLMERAVSQSTKIYDRTGEHLLYEIHGAEKRTLISLSDVPATAKLSTLVAEDRDFYTHHGFSVRAIFRSLVVNILGRGKIQGGSTITQQLIKNAVLGREKTYTRKLKELILAYELERRFTKDDILQLYFNEIPYGSTAYGIEAAAQMFFGKSARDLDLAEASLLAALPKAPSYYSPYGSHTDDLLARTRYILDELANEGMFPREETDAAKKVDVLARVQPRREGITAPHFVFYVRELLGTKYGERFVENGGLRVITSLDFDLQTRAEKTISEQMLDVEKLWNAKNASLVSMDPKTGEILAMVGSRDYFNEENDGNVNVALRPRQPGSSFKPIAYAAAFLKGYTPTTVLYDVETVFKTDTKDYAPKNYDGKEHGPVTMRQALAGSLNIPAVKTLYLTGVPRVLDLAESFGYTTLGDRSRFGLSLVLGGGEVRLLDHASAFGVFATEGMRTEPAAILRVEDSTRRILEEYRPEPKRVLDPEIARHISDILSDNNARAFIFGSENFLTLPDRPVAAKTGTTNDFRDAWTLGYTPSIVTGVWVGNNDNSAMKTGADGSKIAAPIWNAVMRFALDGKPAEAFTPPLPVITGKPILDGESAPSYTVRIDRISGKLATPATPPTAIEERTYRAIHSILHYVQKDDPRGPEPPNPAADPQYENWEAGIQTWAAKNNIFVTEPPKEFDDVHAPGSRPLVTITDPIAGASIAERTLTVQVSLASTYEVSRVEYFVDGRSVAVSRSAPFHATFTLGNAFGRGVHTLSAVAYDVLENSGSAEQSFELTSDPPPITLSWIEPMEGSTVSAPVTLRFTLSDASIDRVDILARGDGLEITVAGAERLEGGQVELHWQNAQAGTYALVARIRFANGSERILSEERTVTIQ
ncbi:MAG: PBP1A family penicillin-binding protein [Patescibacteria group bacterium]